MKASSLLFNRNLIETIAESSRLRPKADKSRRAFEDLSIPFERLRRSRFKGLKIAKQSLLRPKASLKLPALKVGAFLKKRSFFRSIHSTEGSLLPKDSSFWKKPRKLPASFRLLIEALYRLSCSIHWKSQAFRLVESSNQGHIFDSSLIYVADMLYMRGMCLL